MQQPAIVKTVTEVDVWPIPPALHAHALVKEKDYKLYGIFFFFLFLFFDDQGNNLQLIVLAYPARVLLVGSENSQMLVLCFTVLIILDTTVPGFHHNTFGNQT